MRYATFSTSEHPTPRLGVAHGGGVSDLQHLLASGPALHVPATLIGLIQTGPVGWRRIAEAVERALSARPPAEWPADRIRWHAPIPRPTKNIVCLGLNYVSHVAETTPSGRQAKAPDVPIFFTKAPTAVNGPYDAIPWDPSATSQVDYEAELGVVVGVGGKNIPRAQAREHVFGYTVVNDVSARDLQFGHKQWFKGKSLDGFCPMGPVVVTADEFGDPQTKRISLRVNGETRQSANTSEMIFPVDVILEFLSRGMTVEPGDIIATGTPEGVGLGRTPPAYLENGDVVETEIEGIGVLRNQISITSL
jgi:2-keto-4-pentenoate hydratase/2-oxohepta-3-ene-1,7-dioic acid hydratase in catechol pathway